MDPLRAEPTWVTPGRIVGWLLLEAFGAAFLIGLMVFAALGGTASVGNGVTYILSILGSLAGIGLLLVLFLRPKTG